MYSQAPMTGSCHCATHRTLASLGFLDTWPRLNCSGSSGFTLQSEDHLSVKPLGSPLVDILGSVHIFTCLFTIFLSAVVVYIIQYILTHQNRSATQAQRVPFALSLVGRSVLKILCWGKDVDSHRELDDTLWCLSQ